jgi:hypothetical protein
MNRSALLAFFALLASLSSLPASAQDRWPHPRNLESLSSYSSAFLTEETCFVGMIAKNDKFKQSAAGRDIEEVVFYSDLVEAPCTAHSRTVDRDKKFQFYMFLKANFRHEMENIRAITDFGFFEERDRKEAERQLYYYRDNPSNRRVIHMRGFTYEPGKYWFHPERTTIGPEAFAFFYPSWDFDEEY